MDQKDSANNQSIVKTIMMGSRILAQGIYKGEAAKGAIQILTEMRWDPWGPQEYVCRLLPR